MGDSGRDEAVISRRERRRRRRVRSSCWACCRRLRRSWSRPGAAAVHGCAV